MFQSEPESLIYKKFCKKDTISCHKEKTRKTANLKRKETPDP
jgi:hypothetical protein